MARTRVTEQSEDSWLRGFIAAVAWARRWARFNDSDVRECLRNNGVTAEQLKTIAINKDDLSVIRRATSGARLPRR